MQCMRRDHQVISSLASPTMHLATSYQFDSAYDDSDGGENDDDDNDD